MQTREGEVSPAYLDVDVAYLPHPSQKCSCLHLLAERRLSHCDAEHPALLPHELSASQAPRCESAAHCETGEHTGWNTPRDSLALHCACCWASLQHSGSLQLSSASLLQSMQHTEGLAKRTLAPVHAGEHSPVLNPAPNAQWARCCQNRPPRACRLRLGRALQAHHLALEGPSWLQWKPGTDSPNCKCPVRLTWATCAAFLCTWFLTFRTCTPRGRRR